MIVNDSLGCNSVSWAPYHPITSHTGESTGLIYRLVTGSCDNIVRIWSWTDDSAPQQELTVDSPHKGNFSL
jgi:hypothetical protein